MKPTIIKTVCLVAACALLVGCNTDSEQANSNQEQDSEAHSHSHPKLSLHKPKTLSSAVQRLRLLHQSMVSEGEFPTPLTIDYVEVIHGKGSSGHSHYYSAADFDTHGGDDHEDEHHEEDEEIKRHSMEIGPRMELADVAGWLPSIAAKSNLNEADWNSVKKISTNLTTLLESIASDASDTSFRDSWKLKSEEIESQLDELQSFVDSAGDSK